MDTDEVLVPNERP